MDQLTVQCDSEHSQKPDLERSMPVTKAIVKAYSFPHAIDSGRELGADIQYCGVFPAPMKSINTPRAAHALPGLAAGVFSTIRISRVQHGRHVKNCNSSTGSRPLATYRASVSILSFNCSQFLYPQELPDYSVARYAGCSFRVFQSIKNSLPSFDPQK